METPASPSRGLVSRIVDSALDVLGNDVLQSRIDAVSLLQLYFQPGVSEHAEPDRFVVMQSRVGVGVACVGDHALAADLLLGKSVADLLAEPDMAIVVAAADLICSGILPRPTARLELHGSSTTKATQRATVICDELQAATRWTRRPVATVVGAVGTIIEELLIRGFEVRAVDMDPAVIGRAIGSCVVGDGRKMATTVALIEDSDAVLITGMAAATDTISELIDSSNTAETISLVFAQTGSSLAPWYRAHGVDLVVSEPFPFYLLPGTSQINIYRRSSDGH